MIGRVSLWIGCGILLLSFGASAALAQNGAGGLQGGFGVFGGGGGGGYGFGYFNYGSGINNSNDHIPFYALYPPVYYSYPVPRPYGYSPFAYPPGIATPETPIPAEFLNPYVPRKAESKPASERTTGPRMYINPFVAQGRAASSVSLADPSSR